MKEINVDGIKNSTELIKLLETNGWTLARVKGSHHVFKKEGIQALVTIPHPKKDLPIGTIKAILRNAEL